MNPHPNLTPEVIRGIGWLYVLLFAMNVFWTIRAYKRGHDVGSIAAWALYTVMLGVIGATHLTKSSGADQFIIAMPGWLKATIDAGAKPEIYFILSTLLFFGVIWFREQLIKPTISWLILNGMILFMALSMTDYDFRQIVGK